MNEFASLAALGAAACWAIGSTIAADASRAMGGIAFTRLRMVFVVIMLLAWLAFVDQPVLADGTLSILILSGLIGIFIGDTALFVTLSRLGPRRTSILFSANAPFTAVLAWWWLDERFSAPAAVGCALVALGVVVAIIYGKRREQRHVWESVRGSLIVGVAIGLLAALGQSVGSLLAKPALDAGTDPVTAATVRNLAALAGLYASRWLLPRYTRPSTPLTPMLTLRLAASGFFGMALGMTLLLYAFQHGSVGLSAALSSTTPILLIPIIWCLSRERPAAGAWLGAALAVVGSAMIVLA